MRATVCDVCGVIIPRTTSYICLQQQVYYPSGGVCSFTEGSDICAACASKPIDLQKLNPDLFPSLNLLEPPK
jgi:hypothetical protein